MLNFKRFASWIVDLALLISLGIVLSMINKVIHFSSRNTLWFTQISEFIFIFIILFIILPLFINCQTIGTKLLKLKVKQFQTNSRKKHNQYWLHLKAIFIPIAFPLIIVSANFLLQPLESQFINKLFSVMINFTLLLITIHVISIFAYKDKTSIFEKSFGYQIIDLTKKEETIPVLKEETNMKTLERSFFVHGNFEEIESL